MITVFTPIYNRAYIINQLYQSLLRQTNHAFEWLVIDDGSTDHIGEMMNAWIQNTKAFKIRFYQQENGGKHRAINRGVQLAKGDAFMIVDSDDFLTDDAIDIVCRYWEEIKDNNEYAGISGLRIDRDGQVIGEKPLFEKYVDATNLERGKYGLLGDKAEVYKTEILQKFPFPEYEGEQFLSEGIVWDKIAYCGYKIRWINRGIIVGEYLEDGLTANIVEVKKQNPKGWAAMLCAERVYQAWTTDDFLRQCLNFYEMEHLYLQPDEIQKLLEMSGDEMTEINGRYLSIKKRLKDICKDKMVSIYAYGGWGRRLKRYLDELNISVDYIVDRKHQNTGGIAQYDPSSNLPDVDILFVALKNGQNDVISALKGKMKQTQVVNLKDVVGKWW